MIRVLLAEDQAMIRRALAALLATEGDIAVVAEVGRGDDVVPAAIRVRPDVALLDIDMPGIDGISAAAELRACMPACRILILTTFGRPGYLRRALEAGAAGYVLKDSPASELAAAVRIVAANGRAVDPGLAVAALSEGESPLSPREQQVLRAGGNGASVAEIAVNLCLSEGTVRNHISSAIQKLGARNRGEAAHIAELKGWL